jgi:uncharacterized protein YuzE
METSLERATVQTVTEAVPLLLGLSLKRFWVDYDREADVLYISLRHPQRATDSQMTEDGILLRYHNKELVGITVLEASTRTQTPPTPKTRPSAVRKRKRSVRTE